MSVHERSRGSEENWKNCIVYTAVDIKCMFVDAVDGGELINGEILGYEEDDSGGPICAIIRNKIDSMIGLYRMNLTTGRPYLVRIVVPPNPPGTAPQRPGRRRARHHESKEWRARKRWEER